MKNKVFILFIITTLMYILSFEGTIKYIVSLSSMGILFIYNSVYKKKGNKHILKLVFLLMLPIIYYFIHTIVVSLFKGEYKFYIYFMRQLIFMSIPIIVSYSIVKLVAYTDKNLDLGTILFWSLAIAFLFKNINRINNLINLDSDLFEGTEAFIFGVFIIYFMYKSNKKLTILSFLLMYLGHKRIALVASIMISIMYLIIKKLNKKKSRKYIIIMYIFILVASLIYIFFIKTNQLDIVFKERGINSMGRINIYNYLKPYYDLDILFNGVGMGFSEYILSSYDLSYAKNLHSDILKLYIELGSIGYIIYTGIQFLISLFISKYNNKLSLLYICIIVFTTINSFTDNIITYIHYLIPIYIILIHEFNRELMNEKINKIIE